MSQTPTAVPARALATLVACVVVLGLTLTWAFLSMRAVMDVGGACADGGPYVSAQPCPGGAGFIGVAIPVMMLVTFAGTFVAFRLQAPNLLVPMWTLLFGSLGWNFLEYGFDNPGGELVAGWIVCGVVFELMALPGLLVVVASGGGMWSTGSDDSARSSEALMWWGIYLGLGAVGAVLGAWSFHAWR